MAERSSAGAKAATESAPGSPRRETQPPAVLGLAATLLGLQQTTGNHGVGQLLGGAHLQPKLRIGPPGDAYEREADRVAEAVLHERSAPVSVAVAGGTGVQRTCPECEEERLQRSPSPAAGLVQRQCDCQDEEEASLQRSPSGVRTGLVQRRCDCQDEEEGLVQPKADGAPSPATPAFEARVAALAGTGRPLPANLRGFFEPRFGQDFGAVRVHTGGAAGEAARAVGARAFAVGNDVVFGAGEWSPETTPGRRLLAHELTHVVQQTPLARRQPVLQRAPREGREATDPTAEPTAEPQAPEPAPEAPIRQPGPGEPEIEPASAEAAPAAAVVVDGASEAAPADRTPAAAVVVEDEASDVGDGQMRKSEFLAHLRTAVCAAAEAGLAGTEHEAQGCPIIDFWFGHYEGQSAESFNRDLPRFVAAGRRPATAAGFIALIAARVRLSVESWARTGEITGVPPGIPLPGMGLPALRGATTALSSLGGVFLKALPGAPRDPGSPQALRAQLGAGRPLDGGIRSRMESAFGRSFAHVALHTDGRAAGLSHRLNARAFTVGSHVAFGAGEYRPGTLGGDALMAHELAHVAQQHGAAEPVRPMRPDAASSGALERDADLAAAGAVASLWGLRLPGVRLPLRAVPRLSAGLRLQRCRRCGSQAAPTVPSTALGPDPAQSAQPTPAATPPRLTFTTADKGARAGTCGSFSWQTQWMLDRPTTKGGIVVQRIHADFENVKDCADQDVRNDIIFWEAWTIRPNQRVTTITQAGHAHDDEFVIATPVPDTKGRLEFRGAADFYEGQTLPADFQVDPTSPAMELPTTVNDPRLTGGSGRVDRTLAATWDCCDPNRSPATTLEHP